MPGETQAVCCSVCQGQGECTCVECPNCNDHVNPDDVCDCCHQCTGCCDCSHCDGCDSNFDSDDNCSNCDNCPSCCECIECDGCGDRFQPDHICGDCERCTDCCECVHCGRCGRAIDEDDQCDECHCCPRHCGCEKCPVTFVTRGTRFHNSGLGGYKENKSKRYLACELECSDADSGREIGQVAKTWQMSIVKDGSLPDTGFEVCTSPANGDKFLKQIRDLCRAFRVDGAEVDEDCCGYHVHADARDFTYWDVRKVILLYAKLEDALFDCVPDWRRSNDCCEPCGEIYAKNLMTGKDWRKYKAKDDVIKNVYGYRPWTKTKATGDNWKTTRAEKYQPARYHAMNLHSWFLRGTIECRLAPGTTDAVTIVNWAMTWGAVLDYAYKHTEKQIVGMKSDPWAVLMEVAPSDVVGAWLTKQRDSYK